MKSRTKQRAEARGLYCFLAVSELGIALSELARRLNITPAGVGYAVRRGEGTARRIDYDILE